MTYYEGEPYMVTVESRQWYRCDGDGCHRISNTTGLYGWQTVRPDGDYGDTRHYCPWHRADRAEARLREAGE